MLRLPSRGSFVVRALTLAPCCTSLPHQFEAVEISCRHRAGRLKPALCRRDQAIWCSAVHPCASAFGSGARSSSRRGELVVRVHDREQQRAGSVGQRLVDVDSGIEQRARRLDVTAADGEQERRERAALRARLRRRRRPRSAPSTAAALFSAAAHISAVCPFRRLARVDVRAAREQRLDRRDVAGPRRRHQHRLAVGQRRVRIGARGQQPRDHRGIAVGAGELQRRHAVAIRGSAPSRRREQHIDGLRDRLDAPPSAARSCRRPRRC